MRVPAIMLLAAVLVAEGVSFVLVGSAGLHLHGERVLVAGADDVRVLRARFKDVDDD